MNEPTAPTAPTIEEMLAYLDNEGPELNTATEIDAMVAAIRVLEAAAKVDKTEADIWLLNARWAECDTAHDCGMRGVVRGLISALPDAPKEEK